MTQAAKYDLFISYADADRAWVEGYLLDALKQAGVRYCSQAEFASGHPRLLLEVERAIQQSRHTLLVLSPAYMASDFNQFIALVAQHYGLETGTWQVIPLILEPVTLPLRLRTLVSLNATNPDEWEEAIERLCANLQYPVPGLPTKPPCPCPYPGMLPFSEADSDRFFGREREVEKAIERLHLYPFITVIGPSGSGKSSLVFAGIIPALRRSELFGSGEWLISTIRPGQTPLTTLENALGDSLADPRLVVAKALATQPNAQRLLLIVDRFEEVFTQAEQEAVPFQEVLLRLIETPNCYLILTVRAEFYDNLMKSLLWPKIQSYRLEVTLMDKARLREAITKPAENVGVFIERALVERLLADAGREPGTLPLIQETLVLLWQNVERRLLPLRAYEDLAQKAYGALGSKELTGFQMVIAYHADVAVVALSEEQRQIARRIFLRLIQFGEGRADTRRQQSVDQLRSFGEDARLFDQTLLHLADRRLLTLSGREEDSSQKVDIAHEVLIESWPALHWWLTERRDAERTRRLLMRQVEEWVRLGKGSGGLLAEEQLAEANRWLSSPDAKELGYDETLIELVEASDRAIWEARQQKEEAEQRELELIRERLEQEKIRKRLEQENKALKRPWFQISLGKKDDPITRKKKQKIEEEARMWREQGKSLKMSNLLQGSKLTDAETFRRDYGDKYPLSNLAQEFIDKSIEKREKSRKIKDILLQINKNLPDYRSQVTKVENIVQALASTIPDSEEFSQSLEHLHVYVNNLEPHSEVLLKQIEELTTNANNSS